MVNVGNEDEVAAWINATAQVSAANITGFRL
jgi:hypothetical protein